MLYKVEIKGFYLIDAADSGSAQTYIEAFLPSPSNNKAIKAMEIIAKSHKKPERRIV